VNLWQRIYAERRAVLLPLIVLLVANVGVLMLAVLPLRTSMAAAETEEREAAADLGNARRLSEQAAAASTSRQQADVQLKQFYGSVLPKDFATARKTATLWLEQAASDAGLSFRSSHFVPETIKDSRLSRAAGTLVLQGRYDAIRRFLHAVETAEEFIVIERVELAQTDATQLSNDNALAIEIAVSTYFLTPAAR
jgi:Tfp pilus assembly protein PilO